MVMERYPSFYGESSRQIPDGNAPQTTGKQPCNGLIHNNYWINVVRSCGQQVVFSLNENRTFNGGNAAKPPPQKKLRSRFSVPVSEKQPANHIKKESEQFSDILVRNHIGILSGTCIFAK